MPRSRSRVFWASFLGKQPPLLTVCHTRKQPGGGHAASDPRPYSVLDTLWFDPADTVVVVAVPGSLMVLTLLWLHLEVGGENDPPLGNQLSKLMSVTFDSHLNAARLNVFRQTHDLDASPHGRDARMLEPNAEFGG